jgi:hypothetical protein
MAGAWIEFDAVDFGVPGQFGRFQAQFVGATSDRHLELHLDSPTGALVANLFTLATDQPQSTRFLLTNVSGVHRVVVVATTSDVGNIDWFSLEAPVGKDTVSHFPTTFHHSNPGEGFPLPTTPSPGAGEREDIRRMGRLSVVNPFDLGPGESNSMHFTTSETMQVVGTAKWAEAVGTVKISVLGPAGQVLSASMASSTVAGTGRVRVATANLAPQKLVVSVTNMGSGHLTMTLQVSTMGQD